MKILFFMNHVGEGGAALALFDLIVELISSYHDVIPIVFTGKHNGLNIKLDRIGVENHTSCYKNFCSSTHKPEWFWKRILLIRHNICLRFAIRKIEQLVDFGTVDIIHSNLNRIDIGAILAKKHNIPHVWHIREHLKGGFALLPIYNHPIRYMNNLSDSIRSVYVCTSISICESWGQEGLNHKRMQMIYDGIDISRIPSKQPRNRDVELSNEITEENDESHKIWRIIALGGYDAIKGQYQILEALSKIKGRYLNRIEVDFYGNGKQDYRKILEQYIIENRMDHMVHLNNYDPNIYSILKNYDIGLNCSRSEGFGRATIEYMAAGLVPIVANTGANVELVHDKDTGLVFQYGNSDELASSIISLVEDQHYLNRLSEKAKEYAENHFSIKHHTNRIYGLYESLLCKE